MKHFPLRVPNEEEKNKEFPEGLFEAIVVIAKENNRSINSEIVTAIKNHVKTKK